MDIRRRPTPNPGQPSTNTKLSGSPPHSHDQNWLCYASKPGETGQEGDDLAVPAHAGFLVDALQLIAGRLNAHAKILGGGFQRPLGQEPYGEARLRRREPE